MIKEAPGGVQFEWDEAKAESYFETQNKVSDSWILVSSMGKQGRSLLVPWRE
jgi:hypothetical protein